MKLFDITIDIMLLILPIIYIIFGIVGYEIIKKIIKKVTINSKKRLLKKQQKQRLETLVSLILNIIKYIIVVIVIVGILATYGINVTSIVAGLGVTTAIIGLAFQDLAKDIIAGFSIITEAQYEVGDTIEVDGFMGEVVFLGLKTTRIRDYKGATKIIANHNMDKIINYSLNNSLAVVDIPIDYDNDAEKVEKVLNNLAEELDGTIKEAKGKMQVWGINGIEEGDIIFRVVLEVEPMKHIAIERYLRKEIKRAFDKAGIKEPFSRFEVHNGK